MRRDTIIQIIFDYVTAYRWGTFSFSTAAAEYLAEDVADRILRRTDDADEQVKIIYQATQNIGPVISALRSRYGDSTLSEQRMIEAKSVGAFCGVFPWC
ncbi:MAG: hypothetical protein ACFE0S_02500 [Rhodospirillales bacterium]